MEPQDGLAAKLALAEKEGRPLRVKLGFDPTAPDLHLGHAVVLEKLHLFQQYGHKIIVIIGDFTARIGDPTGRNKLRPPLSVEQIEANAQTYIDQLGLILDISQLEVRRNSEWLSRLDLAETIKLLSKVTAAQILQREDFKKRYEGGLPIAMHELLYPLLQGYDSVMIDADIEIGGTDQLFNCLMGRHLQESFAKVPQTVIAMPLLVGLDGVEKMSKSKANYIGLTESAEAMFGKVMSVPDMALPSYIRWATTFDASLQNQLLQQLGAGDNPMQAKLMVAANVVQRFYGVERAALAREHFRRTVQERAHDESDYNKISLAACPTALQQEVVTLLDLCGFLEPDTSRGALRRLIEGGGVRVAEQKITDFKAAITLTVGLKVHLGKRALYLFTE